MPGNSISAQKSRPLAPFHPHGNTQGDTPWKPSRILLVRLSHLGDACHALAVYHALRQAYPQAELWWAVQPEFSDLLRNLPGIKGHLPFDRRGGFAAWPRLRKAARRIGFDLCVDAQGNWKSAWVARFSGAPVRLGLARADWREAGAHRLTNHHASPAQGVHAMHRMQALAQALNPGGTLRYDLPLTEEERRLGRERLAQALPSTEGRPRRILHLAAPRDPRSWPVESFGQLAQGLAEAGETVLCLSGPGEAELGAQLAQQLAAKPNIKHLAGQRGLRDLAGMLAAAAEQKLRMLACDSGPSHVAAAVGLGVDLLAGPTDPARTGPWSDPGEPALHLAYKKNPLRQLMAQEVLDWLLGASGP